MGGRTRIPVSSVCTSQSRPLMLAVANMSHGHGVGGVNAHDHHQSRADAGNAAADALTSRLEMSFRSRGIRPDQLDRHSISALNDVLSLLVCEDGESKQADVMSTVADGHPHKEQMPSFAKEPQRGQGGSVTVIRTPPHPHQQRDSTAGGPIDSAHSSGIYSSHSMSSGAHHHHGQPHGGDHQVYRFDSAVSVAEQQQQLTGSRFGSAETSYSRDSGSGHEMGGPPSGSTVRTVSECVCV